MKSKNEQKMLIGKLNLHLGWKIFDLSMHISFKILQHQVFLLP